MAKVAGPDFKALLSKPLDSFERPVGIPAGTYFAVIKDTTFGKSRFNKEKPALIVNIVLTGPTEDVPADELGDIDLAKLKFHSEFEWTAERMYLLNDFLESLGHDTKGKPADEFLLQLPGADVLAVITANTSANGKDTFNNVRKIIGA